MFDTHGRKCYLDYTMINKNKQTRYTHMGCVGLLFKKETNDERES